MKLHHAAALALLGWYLISPPRVPGGPPPPMQSDYAAPLFQWNRGGTYFSNRKKCEDYRQWLLNLRFGMADPEASLMREALKRSFCIEENDPRLYSK